ncbi:MAG: hypothetical protein PHX20_07680, partial [Candidatus Omnitrophica bacterium]|nr:hypothetical protein [Candidatus Omnitrophota bacterium]
GRVVRVDMGGPSLTVRGIVQIDFPISRDTMLQRDDSDIRLSDISVGDYVTVEYYRSETESRAPAKVTKVTVEYR